MPSWRFSAKEFDSRTRWCEGPSSIRRERPLLSSCIHCQFSSGWSLNSLFSNTWTTWTTLKVLYGECPLSLSHICFSCRFVMEGGTPTSGIERKTRMKMRTSNSLLVHNPLSILRFSLVPHPVYNCFISFFCSSMWLHINNQTWPSLLAKELERCYQNSFLKYCGSLALGFFFLNKKKQLDLLHWCTLRYLLHYVWTSFAF